MVYALRYFEDQNHLAGDVLAGRVQPTIEGLAAAFEELGGYSPYEAVDNAIKFLEGLQAGVDRLIAGSNPSLVLHSTRRAGLPDR